MSNVVLEDLLSEFTHPMETIQRRNLSLTVETQDTTMAKQLPGVELEISHGFDDAPEPGSTKTGKCTYFLCITLGINYPVELIRQIFIYATF